MPIHTTIRLSVSEAARLFGVSQRTIRRAIQSELVDFSVLQGRYKISFDSILRWSHNTTTVRNKRDKRGLGQYVAAWHALEEKKEVKKEKVAK